MPRSGTSLVEQILSTHSSIFGAGELTYVNNMIERMNAGRQQGALYPLCLDSIDAGMMDDLASRLLSDIRTENSDILKICDKLPHNFLHIGLIHKLLPNAKFINCVRDARDTCLSCYFQYFAGYHPYANNLKSLGMHYLEYQRLMDHWIHALSIPVHNVIYEDLVSDIEGEAKRMIDYIGLKWEPECLEFYKNKRTVATASYNQVNKNIYTNSIGRWKNYESHMEPLLNVLNYRS